MVKHQVKQKTSLSSADEDSRDHMQPSTSYRPSLKRKSSQQDPGSSLPAQDPLPSNRPRTSTRYTAVKQAIKKHTSATAADPVRNWVLNETWPAEYFEPDDQEPLERDSWLEEMMALPPTPVVQYAEMNGFRYPLPVRKMPTSLCRKQSDSSLTDSSLNESSNQKSRDSKSISYRNSRYQTLLEAKGSFLRDFGDDDPPTTITDPGRDLLSAEQAVPENRCSVTTYLGDSAER